MKEILNIGVQRMLSASWHVREAVRASATLRRNDVCPGELGGRKMKEGSTPRCHNEDHSVWRRV